MANKISTFRYIFTESFSYKIPEKKHIDYIGSEICNLIPIISIFTSTTKLYDSVKKNRVYHDKTKIGHRMIYDIRFSKCSIILHFINTIGLGILILPIRLIATYMKNFDEKNGYSFDNPHFLNDIQFRSCTDLNNNKQEYCEGILKYVPNEIEYVKRMIHRNHILYPEYSYKSLCQYPDPFRKAGDEVIEAIIEEKASKLRDPEKVKQIIKEFTQTSKPNRVISHE